MEKNSRALEIGQVWSFKNTATQLAIVGLSKHLAEVRLCRDGKVLSAGRDDLQLIRIIQELIAKGSATLVGHVVMPERFLTYGVFRQSA